MPAGATPIVSSAVATGRAIKMADGFMPCTSWRHLPRGPFGSHDLFARRREGEGVAAEAAAGEAREAVEAEIDDRGREQRQHLAQDQAADDRDPQRVTQFGAGAGAE